ncbi:bifunctional adenosylcobinamide kinase/adenosylcobinamide-phosphate guanylyltransferase [Fretibacterium fastidiosum]|uniref:Adenosyl cobinamide kinase/adenosyl cobinamide phosphate guanylyltransferase n=1 Tax=Fretibacterium fastidiosum TaxID=651822 RepID=A0AB94IYV2_9BACT|nr:bifunctional adenosylcobinamide kinase/adenosylcobinamide-phosphate guanylyltransferase [Fretibacterium fastidiosum]CBL28915.1 Adenosyl cobinamide kinase/adenosyl cobinamide phosphate guanylyltransferase [Fretibacterium fastidiosum]
MHLILGGRHMGKRTYADSLYGPALSPCDLASADLALLPAADRVLNLQEGVRRLLLAGTDAGEFFRAHLEDLRTCVLIGSEVGSGVVPMDPIERRWRDETGLLYQLLAREAAIVDRVWCGLPLRLKG